MSSKQNVGDEEMKGDQQPSLKEVVRGYLKSVPDEKLKDIVQKLEEAMVYNREDLLEKSRETLEKALGAAAGSSLYDALHKSAAHSKSCTGEDHPEVDCTEWMINKTIAKMLGPAAGAATEMSSHKGHRVYNLYKQAGHIEFVSYKNRMDVIKAAKLGEMKIPNPLSVEAVDKEDCNDTLRLHEIHSTQWEMTQVMLCILKSVDPQHSLCLDIMQRAGGPVDQTNQHPAMVFEEPEKPEKRDRSGTGFTDSEALARFQMQKHQPDFLAHDWGRSLWGRAWIKNPTALDQYRQYFTTTLAPLLSQWWGKAPEVSDENLLWDPIAVVGYGEIKQTLKGGGISFLPERTRDLSYKLPEPLLEAIGQVISRAFLSMMCCLKAGLAYDTQTHFVSDLAVVFLVVTSDPAPKKSFDARTLRQEFCPKVKVSGPFPLCKVAKLPMTVQVPRGDKVGKKKLDTMEKYVRHFVSKTKKVEVSSDSEGSAALQWMVKEWLTLLPKITERFANRLAQKAHKNKRARRAE